MHIASAEPLTLKPFGSHSPAELDGDLPQLPGAPIHPVAERGLPGSLALVRSISPEVGACGSEHMQQDTLPPGSGLVCRGVKA